MDTIYHGNTSLLLVSLILVFTSKISDANKNAILLYYSVYFVAFTKAALLVVKETFCIHLSAAIQSVERCGAGLLGYSSV